MGAETMPSGGDARSTVEGVTLRAMEVFVAVVEIGSMSAATQGLTP
jgi:hypothetical protein